MLSGLTDQAANDPYFSLRRYPALSISFRLDERDGSDLTAKRRPICLVESPGFRNNQVEYFCFLISRLKKVIGSSYRFGSHFYPRVWLFVCIYEEIGTIIVFLGSILIEIGLDDDFL
jgi:hypothetical protein